MDNKKASQTAIVVSLIRASSNCEAIPQLKSDDYLANLFIWPVFKLMIKFNFVRRLIQKKLPYGIYESIITRTKYIDEVFSKAIKNGFEQIIIFGAGFDTRAIRLIKGDANIKIWEIDQPQTQSVKIQQYKNKHISINPNNIYISLDLNNMSFEGALNKTGFKKDKKTLFIMEGLLMYLDTNSVDALFKEIDELGCKGSEVVFDYIYSSYTEGKKKEKGGPSAKEIVEKIDERWRFGIEEEKIENFLKDKHLKLVEQLNGQDLNKRYFKDISKPIEVRISQMSSIVLAQK